ncbi:Uma2 family endonuclease [Nodosilinea sp. LEGE 07298]|uniref:Uma2 family endonuclease n=1 Tax=Nodosilinea sp. LEGE 07298 TaxID=2777970 RepID=UPI00188227EF|nr:Uma2 family endonuclease [Nodosilinea sp. LEGE 07298]MBE9109091.1 Uma2 family endonuclease [Nodosilinea sp. LEGE 07298]
MTYPTGHSVAQTNPPRSPRETLPTMYDLPSEFPEEPGLPDEFHDLQPQLLSRTLALSDYSRDQWFTGSDLNLYYDVHHPLWHKRPDWFLAVGVPRLYDGYDLRRSYVVWQEGVAPAVVVEFLSPRTEQEDLGRFYQEEDQVESEEVSPEPVDLNQIPGKLDVYETYLRVAHYVVYSRYTQRLRYFKLIGRQYEEQRVNPSPLSIWLSDLNIGLGVWEGEFEGIPGHWLRWCNAQGNWLLTDTEQEYQAKRQAQLQTQDVQQRADRLAQRLRELGVDPDEI